MPFRLAAAADRMTTGWLKRFDPRFWTVDFPRPMMAAVTTTAADALRVDAVFYDAGDLAGLIWEAEDRWDHPLLAYETNRDFRRCQLRFHWRSAGLRPLDAVDGPTLTIEGRDVGGTARSWYVRLWNYAAGTPEDADIAIDFGALDGGFLLPGEAERVWAGDIDRMFISLVPPDYASDGGPLASPAEGWVELTAMSCDGSGSVLAIGDVLVPAHGLRIATGYDDAYNLTPARLLRQMVGLGYRALIDHYVGMSHYFRLAWNAAASAFLVSPADGVLNPACDAWHADFLARAKALGFGVILSMSYELFDEHCPADWKQRAWDGASAATGWVPPSTLLSPAQPGAVAYLRQVAQAFTGHALAAGQPVRFQVGEPWWWVMPDGRPCLYDDAVKAAFGGAPPEIASVYAPLTADQIALLDQAGVLLATSTAAIRDAVRELAPDAQALVLVYLPTVLDPRAPELRRANAPVGWATPAWDILQIEDYDWVIAGDAGATARGVGAMQERLGYPPSAQHYFAGFVLNHATDALWREIDAAAERGRARGVAETFLWAMPQVSRDGFTHWDEEAPVQAFDDVEFPLAIGQHASVEPAFSTAIVTSAAGFEQRNADWADARMRYDAGPGIRSEADVQALIGFFRARRGAAKGFRFNDPYDDSSNGMTGEPTLLDQPLGTGDGATTRFPIVKFYGTGADADARRITRPEPGTVLIGVDGAAATTGWTLADGGFVDFTIAPAPGAVLTAGFRFDVPVRFAEDSLTVSRANFLAGELASVPLIEVRESAA